MARITLDRIHWVLMGLVVGLLVFVVVLLAGGNDGPEVPDETIDDPTGVTPTSTSAEPRPAPPGDTLAAVRGRGRLNCGVRASDLPGFLDLVDGEVSGGFDYEFCRALAAVVLGDADAVNPVQVNAGQRWTALRNPEQIDVLIRNTTWTSGRDVEFDFGPVTFYDGQQVMGTRDVFDSSSDINDLDGSKVCVAKGTTSYDRIGELKGEKGWDTEIIQTEDVEEAVEELAEGKCDAVTADGSALLAELSDRAATGRWVIFPNRPISKEPLGPVVRRDDSQWRDIVSWTVYALLIADEKSIKSSNIDEKRTSAVEVETRLLLGLDPGFADRLGLDPDAFARAIEQVGSYEEIFIRTLAPLGMPRGPNTDPDSFGLLYAPPIRAGT